MDNFSDWLTLEGYGGQTDETRSTFRVPLKIVGYNGSNLLCGRSSASKLRVHKLDTIFWVHTRISVKNGTFSKITPSPKILNGIFSVQVLTESLRTQDSENLYERGVQIFFDSVMVAQSGVRATKCGLLAKL